MLFRSAISTIRGVGLEQVRNFVIKSLNLTNLEIVKEESRYVFTGRTKNFSDSESRPFIIMLNFDHVNSVTMIHIFVLNLINDPVNLVVENLIKPFKYNLQKFIAFLHTEPQLVRFTDEEMDVMKSQCPNRFRYLNTTTPQKIQNNYENRVNHYDNPNPIFGIKQHKSKNATPFFEGILKESDLFDNFARLEWKDAENLVGKLFDKKGYLTSVVGKTGDYGIDVEAKKDDSYLGIQVKHWINDVGTEDVMKTLGGAHRFTKVIIISTKSGFSSQALQFAYQDVNRYRIELWDNTRFKLELRSFVLNK